MDKHRIYISCAYTELDKMHFRWSCTMPNGLCFNDFKEGEQVCNRAPVDFRDGTIPFFASEGILFMQEKYIAPLMDRPGEMLEFYERRDTEGKPYFAAKSGLMLCAVILPYQALDEMTVNNIEIVAKQCRDTFNKTSKTTEDEPQKELDYDAI